MHMRARQRVRDAARKETVGKHKQLVVNLRGYVRIAKVVGRQTRLVHGVHDGAVHQIWPSSPRPPRVRSLYMPVVIIVLVN